MDPAMHLAAAALLNPPVPANPATSVPSSTLFPRLPVALSDAARQRMGRGLHIWKPIRASLRGNALVLSSAGDQAGEPAAVLEVRAAREAPQRGHRGAVVVFGMGGEEVVLEFGDEGRREMWLRALRRVGSDEMPELADFEVLRAVGKGGSGEIFVCRRKGEERLLAMKVVQKFAAFHSDTSLQHSLDERLALQLAADHPFIVRLRYAFQTERALYLITDFASGGDLQTMLNRRPDTRIGEDEARRIFTQLLLAIEHLHSLNIMHRDIKAANVLLDRSGNVQLCDMGLAKFLPAGRFSRTRSFCGTIGSMAPEMALRKRPYSIAVDLWSYGVLLFRCLVGRMPYADKANKSPLRRYADDNEILRRIIQDEVELPSVASGLLSPEARELLRGLLEKDETKRFNLEEVKESAFFAGVNFDAVLEDGHREVRAHSAASVSSVSSDDWSEVVDDLSNFELDRVANLKLNPDEVREYGQARHATSVLGGGNFGSSAKSIIKRVASSGHLRKRPSETSIIGFAYAHENGLDA
jgi:serine/threonine protein kinase